MKTVKIEDLKNFHSLDPSIYSQKKFIEFIARYLKDEKGLSNTYNFLEGKNIKIEEISLSENETNVKISYEKSVGPTGSITQFTAEYGKTYSPGEVTIDVAVQRKSYPLEKVIQPEVDPPINENTQSLESLQSGDTFNASGSNLNNIGPNDTVMAAGGSYGDTTGQGGSLVSNITRKWRHFWGSSNKTDGDEDYLNDFESSLGSLPGNITIDHGPVPTHFVIATPNNIEVLAQGMKLGLTELSIEINSYQQDLSFSKTYRVFISTGKSTGKYTYQIRNK